MPRKIPPKKGKETKGKQKKEKKKKKEKRETKRNQIFKCTFTSLWVLWVAFLFSVKFKKPIHTHTQGERLRYNAISSQKKGKKICEEWITKSRTLNEWLTVLMNMTTDSRDRLAKSKVKLDKS